MTDLTLNNWPKSNLNRTRGLRAYMADQAIYLCKYCGNGFLRPGLKMHEPRCQGTLSTPTDPEYICACGDRKAATHVTCWRCAGRSPALQQLDAELGLTGWHGPTEEE